MRLHEPLFGSWTEPALGKREISQSCSVNDLLRAMPARKRRRIEEAESKVMVSNMQPTLRWTQHAINCSVRSMFPDEWMSCVQIPCVEDLVNRGIFAAYAVWAEQEGLAAEEAAVP